MWGRHEVVIGRKKCCISITKRAIAMLEILFGTKALSESH